MLETNPDLIIDSKERFWSIIDPDYQSADILIANSVADVFKTEKALKLSESFNNFHSNLSKYYLI